MAYKFAKNPKNGKIKLVKVKVEVKPLTKEEMLQKAASEYMADEKGKEPDNGRDSK